MDGFRCCISWFHHDDFLEEFEGITPVSDRIFVVDRDRLTCSGGASSAHLAVWLVDRHVGRAASTKSLHIMIIDTALTGEVPQSGLPIELVTRDALVKKALNLMQQSMDALLTVKGWSNGSAGRRRLARHFRQTLELAPAAADKVIRVSHARFLLESGDRSITQIANETGFCDVSHLINVIREREGVTPQAYRLRVRAAASAPRG